MIGFPNSINVIERLNGEILRHTRVVGTFPDGNSALMLVCARLHYVAGTQWGNKKYINMKKICTSAQKAGIPYRKFHALRHTFAAKLFERDVPLKIVSDYMTFLFFLYLCGKIDFIKSIKTL